MTRYLAVVEEWSSEFWSTNKKEIMRYAKESLKGGAESVDVYATTTVSSTGLSYVGSFYADGEMPRMFNK